jgi:uridine phosphorylase
MPARLRPVGSVAAEAVLVGDPGRSLLLAQELLEQPKMSNHARGLWGYHGQTEAGRELTVQATGMGGPSATLVLADLAELGLRRAVRVGTCVAIRPELGPGDLLLVEEAHAWSGGGAGEALLPAPELAAALRAELGGEVRTALVASLDFIHPPGSEHPTGYADRVDAADMQTAALFAAAAEVGVELAGLLVVAESAGGDQAGDEMLEAAAKRAGRAAANALLG